MIDFVQFLLILQSIFFLLIFVSLMVTDDEKFVTIFMSCWFTTIFLLLICARFQWGVLIR